MSPVCCRIQSKYLVIAGQLSLTTVSPVSLTSVDQAGHEIGRNAARLLRDRIADRHRPSVQIRLSPTLVPRRTTARPPG
ncbi:substrate-binding domain-containing protein [Streptomyces sp. NPDC048825]|uniref:substrate-binding domain-containing protein n=1 Tax=Streptomyces sp. NPDC048825 TaxID=3365592 RepID=UPI00371A4F1A